MRIEHLALNVPAARDQAQWYGQHLGMRIVRHSENNQTHFIVDESGHVLLELYTNPIAPIPDYAAMKPHMLHIAFTVDDIAAEHARLLAAGATPEGDIETAPSGDQLAFLRDPWGITLQLVHRQKPML